MKKQMWNKALGSLLVTMFLQVIPAWSGEAVNLAAGKETQFLPWPNYSRTAKKGNKKNTLTDGHLEKPGTPTTESAVAGWNYVGRVNVLVDLQKRCDITEVEMRFLRSNHHSSNAPVDMTVFVSDDGQRFVQVVQRSPWTEKGLFNRDPIINTKEANIYTWRFSNLKNVRGRYVGLSFYAGGITASDELSVFGNETPSTEASAGKPSSFSVEQPQLYFHKPELFIPANITAPQPLGVFMPAKLQGDLELQMDLPQGISLVAPTDDTKTTALPGGKIRSTLTFKNLSGIKRILTRLYLQASAPAQSGTLSYRYRFGDWQSPDLEMPYRTVVVPATPAPQRLLTGFGWWYGSDNTEWPSSLEAFQQLGLNSITVFSRQMPAKKDDPQWQLVEKARAAGMKIIATDSPCNIMWVGNLKKPSAKEMYCQFEDGTVGGNPKVCPSYRGAFYRQEIERVAKQMARVRPDYIAMDTELWLPQGPPAEQCTRCQKAFRESGMKNWDDFLQSQGNQMEEELVGAIRQKLREQSVENSFVASMFGLTSTEVMERVFNFHKLYPETIQAAQPAYYSPVNSIDLLNIAHMVRENRAQMPRSDVIPWLTPGDGDPIPGEAFEWSILESYCNGARGIYFWSRNCWDGENLLAYSNAIRAIAPVENIILDGSLIGDKATVESPGHLSGMQKDDSMVLLVSDYIGQSQGRLELQLQLAVPSQVRDLQTGEIIATRLNAGKQMFILPLNGVRARLLQVIPVS